jgi:hypothetical protein
MENQSDVCKQEGARQLGNIMYGLLEARSVFLLGKGLSLFHIPR